jgi:sigma-B regulation protein RsbU (phosphoserine phosphatase)
MRQRNLRSQSDRPSSPPTAAESADPARRQTAPESPTTDRQDPHWTQALLEATSQGVLVVDASGLIQLANRQVESLFGWEQNELIGQTVDLLLPPDLRPAHQEQRAAYMRQPAPRPMGAGCELYGQRKDGSDLRVEVGLSPFSTDAGTQVLCLITDITSRVAAEKRIEIDEERFELLFRALPLPTYVWQRQKKDFVLIDYNDADRTYTQAAVRRFLHRGLRVMFPEGGPVVADIEHCYREKGRFAREMLGYRLRTTGEVKDVVFTYVFVEPDLVLTIIEDVTAQRAALSELQTLSNAVEQTADVVFITSRTGVIEYVNPAFERITGYTRAEALGQNPRLLKSGQMPQDYYQRLWETVISGEPFQAQTVNRKRDGTLFVAEQTITPMKDPEGQITHFVSVLKDMTERIRLHEQETEHRLAGMVQQHLFPRQAPQITGYDIAGAVFPAQSTSGDYFDYLGMADNTTGIVVADVCGHGMGAALIMAEARAYLHSITRYESDPRTVLTQLNDQMLPDLADSNFITAFLARLDPERHLLTCANAGNWPAYILDRQGQIIHELWTDGLPIGVLPDLGLSRTDPIPLAPGSIAVFLTDGIPEAFDVDGLEFGSERMLSVIRRHHEAPAGEIVERVRAAVQQFVGVAEQVDDQAIVICKRVG